MRAKKESFAARLNRLFDEKRKPDGTHYTQTEVVDGTRGTLTRVYLWKLLTGRSPNPGFRVIQALADFFGVPASYFFDHDKSGRKLVEEDYRPDELVNQIALRSTELDEDGKQAVLSMIKSIVKSKR